MRVSLPIVRVVASTMLLASPALAQSYTESTSSGFFSSIAGTGTPITLSSTDEGSGSFSAPFSFQFFGVTVASFQTLYVGSNGTLHIGSTVADYTNVSIPNAAVPNDFIAPFWDDLISNGVYYQSTGSAGSRTLIIEWNAAHYEATTESLSFQIQIREATGVIEIHHGPRVGSSTFWTGTIGLENSTGSAGAQSFCSPSCSLSSVANGSITIFTPNGNPPPGQADFSVTYVQSAPSSVQEGASLLVDYEVYNAGLASSPSSSISLFAGASPTVTAGDYEFATSALSSIASGSYGYGTFSFTVPTGFQGTWYLAAIVDPYGLVSETNETNNIYALGSVTITGGGGGFITITTTSLPAGQSGSSYSFQLQQSGAASPFWQVSSGQLPAGLSLSGSGLISGVPSTSGFYSFQVRAEEGSLTPGVADLSINVGTSSGIQLITTQLPPGNVGVPYTGRVEATGGVPPYAFQIISGRPSWLTLDSAGNFSGTPDALGTHQLMISVFDADFADASATLTLDVQEAQALQLSQSMPSGVLGRAYDQALVVGGVPPYTVSVVGGSLPPGLLVEPSGHLAGLPTTAGSFMFTLSAADSGSPQVTVQGPMSVEISELTGLEIALGRELQVFVNTDVSLDLTARGGVPPYTWGIAIGQLQPGLNLDPAGIIVGRVEQVSTATVTFAVTDAEGSRAEAEVFVRATVFRAGGGGGGGRGGRRGGCGCDARAQSDGSTPLILILLGALVFVRRRV